MTTITREQVQKIIDAADEVITALAGTNDDFYPDNSTKMVRLYDDLNDRYAPPEVVRELAHIALAVLTAEPVAYMYKDNLHTDARFSLHTRFGNWSIEDINKYEITEIPLYTATPAPVVSDEYRHLSELYHAQEKRLFKLAQRIKGPSFDKYAYSPSQAIDVLEAAIFGDNEDACSAAMLQGKAEPVSTVYKLDGGENCWSCGKYFTYEQHSECDGYCPHCDSPVDLDDEEDKPSKVVPNNPTEEMVSNAWREAIGKCDHETIKRIYATMLAAAPQQEVK